MTDYIKKHLTRDCQRAAILAIQQQLVEKDRPKCLVKMFCGSGKSRLIMANIICFKKQLSIVVVPSLALIQQFYDSYLTPRKTSAIRKTQYFQQNAKRIAGD